MCTLYADAIVRKYLSSSMRLKILISRLTFQLALLHLYYVFSWLIFGTALTASVVGIVTHNNIIMSNRALFAVLLYSVGLFGIYYTTAHIKKYLHQRDRAHKSLNKLRLKAAYDWEKANK